jgi:hypothetical protein
MKHVRTEIVFSVITNKFVNVVQQLTKVSHDNKSDASLPSSKPLIASFADPDESGATLSTYSFIPLNPDIFFRIYGSINLNYEICIHYS